MSEKTSTRAVAEYLTNFFEDTSEDDLMEVVHQIDPMIITVMNTLIEHDKSIKQVVETTSDRIRDLEAQIKQKDIEITSLEGQIQSFDHKGNMEERIVQSDTPVSEISLQEIMKIIRSATYNARLFLVFKEICERYKILNHPISLRRVHREMGQSRLIQSFNPTTSSSRNSHLTKLIHELFLIYKQGRDYFATPTSKGLQVYELTNLYYSPQQINQRFNSMKTNRELSATKLKLLKMICSSSSPIKNTSFDKKLLADECNVHIDNVSKYLVELVKLGFLDRIPSELVNNRFVFKCTVKATIH